MCFKGGCGVTQNRLREFGYEKKKLYPAQKYIYMLKHLENSTIDRS